MRFERVLLVNPPSKAEWRGLRPHIGLGYISEHLGRNGVEHDVIDMNLGHGSSALLRRIERERPDLVAMTLLTMEYRSFYAIIRRVKRTSPGTAIVVGGPHVTIMREKVLRECPEIDFAVVHEGERALFELCSGVPERDIPGLLYRDEGEIRFSGPRPFEADLDALAWPRYSRFELDRYIPEADIYSSRGCPHQCIFCPNRLLSPIFRPRSASDVVDEMAYWYDRGYRQFNFDDDNFNLVRERVFEICDGIEAAGLRDIVVRCSNGIRADRCDREMLARMREVGFRYIAFGADAGNDRMLEVVKKGETVADIESAVSLACELGYDVKLLFVVGTPHETWEDVEDKVRLSRRHPIQDVHFYNIIPYPGTELYDWIEANGLFLVPPEEYLNKVSVLADVPVFETPELPASERVRLYRYLRGVRSRVHRDAARRLYGPGLAGRAAGRLAGSRHFQAVFYRSFVLRRSVDRLRFGRPRPSLTGGAGEGRARS